MLRAHPQALRLVGADIMCSLVYGMQTVLLIRVASQAGLGLHGYGYLFAASASAPWPARRWPAGRCAHARTWCCWPRWPLSGCRCCCWPSCTGRRWRSCWSRVTGAGAILVEIMTETGLQRTLPPDVFGRAYGLALPASIAGIVVGSLIAPLLASALGTTGALLACGAVPSPTAC